MEANKILNNNNNNNNNNWKLCRLEFCCWFGKPPSCGWGFHSSVAQRTTVYADT